MDPSEVQADKNNDVHSLEQGDGTNDAKKAAPAATDENATPKTGKDGVVDATGGLSPEAAAGMPKRSAFKRFWEKFNLYLMLFILVIVVAVGIVVALTIKSNQEAKTALDSQNLSQQELQQLANTDVTVGNNKQLLTVQSNAVFAGSVLVRSNLEVAGSLKVGGELQLKSLTVTGDTQLDDTRVDNLTVNGALNLQGALSLKNGINVSGPSSFSGPLTASSITTGAFTLNGDLTLTSHIAAGGATPGVSRGTATGSGGTVSLNGSDTAGSVTVNTGGSPPAGCFATVSFTKRFNSTPHVIITPVGSSAAALQYYIDRGTGSFSICTANPAPAGSTFAFDYIALD